MSTWPPRTITSRNQLKWVVVSLAATLVACHVSFWLTFASVLGWPQSGLLAGLYAYPHLCSTVAGAVGGLILGAIQLVLVRHLSVNRRHWLLASAMGGALGGFLCIGYSLGIWKWALALTPEWLGQVLMWAVPGGLWAGVVGGAQFLVLPGLLAHAYSWMLLTMIVTGAAVSWEHGILVLARMFRGLETMGW